MKIFETVTEFREWRQNLKDQSVGFVPTMGALHKGHLSLLERSKRDCDFTAISIFVNPTQFNDPKDLEKYPRPIEHDLQLAREAQVDAVFLPQAAEMYADNYRFQMREVQWTQILCGAKRPGHFDGVLTVVLKLLMLAQPTQAYFGEKDYQQMILIRDMAESFFLPTKITGCPTVREEDGLAMSSRNVRLSPEQRKLAPLLYRELASSTPLSEIKATLEAAGFRIDYLEEHVGRRFVAAFLGDVRLIDNV